MTWKKFKEEAQFATGALMVLALIVAMLWTLGGWKAIVGALCACWCAAWLAAGLLLMYRSVSIRHKSRKETNGEKETST